MENLVDRIIEVNYENLENYVFPRGYQFGLIVYYNNVKYEFLLNINNSSKLLCLGSAAIPRDYKGDRSKPYFNRWSWAFDNYSTIYYNDPTSYIHETLLGGWGIGTEDDWYMESISKILNKIRKNLNVSQNNLYFYGSSMGGFTSLVLGTLNPESKVIADIPQLDITKWYQVHYDNIKKYLFHEQDDEIVKTKYGHRLNILDLIKKENYIPNALFIMDVTCLDDCSLQYYDFLNKLNELPFKEGANKLFFTAHGVNLGHQPLYENQTINIINNIDNIFNSYDENETPLNKKTIYENREYIHYLENKIKKLGNLDLNKLYKDNPQLEKQIKNLKAENSKLRNENKKLKDFRSNVLTSTSWKITEPLRKIIGILKKHN